MRTYREIIRLWPSVDTLAEDIGARVKTVRQWHFRDRIPATFWKAVAGAATRRGIDGVTLDRLADLATPEHKRAA